MPFDCYLGFESRLLPASKGFSGNCRCWHFEGSSGSCSFSAIFGFADKLSMDDIILSVGKVMWSLDLYSFPTGPPSPVFVNVLRWTPLVSRQCPEDGRAPWPNHGFNQSKASPWHRMAGCQSCGLSRGVCITSQFGSRTVWVGSP